MPLNKFTIQKSFAINAGAGSGKTYTLSRRYVNCLLGFDFFKEDITKHQSYFEELKSARVNEIVTITYTEAAALEMKERIFSLIAKIVNYLKIADNRQANDTESINDALGALNTAQIEYTLQVLSQALKDSSNARISTIHSFCMDIIKSNSDLARFDGSLDVVKEYEKNSLIKESIFETLNNPSNIDSANALARDLNMFLLNDLFEKYLTSTKFRNDFNGFSKDSLDISILKELISHLYPLPNVANSVRNIVYEFENKGFDKKYSDFIELYENSFKTFNAKKFNDLAKEMDVEINLRKKEFKEIKDEIKELRTLDDYYAIYSEANEDLENIFYARLEILKSLMTQMKTVYDLKLKTVGKIDFDEIIQKASEIAKQVPKNIKYMMVDEFQDTNSLQYQIIKDSLDVTTNLFVVGDSKQSIYSFQGAQIEVFNNAIYDKSLITSVEPMSINYRSDGAILDNVNNIFSVILKPDDSISLIKQNYEASFQELKVSKEEKRKLGSFRFLLTKKEPSEEANEDDADVNELQNIANFIANIKSGNTPYEHIKHLIDRKKKAIAIVFDSSTKMLELKSILSGMNIDAKISASENFFHTKEITDIFFILKAISLISIPDFQPNDYSNYYLAGAYRSAILKYSDSEVSNFIKDKTIAPELLELLDLSRILTISQLIATIYDKYSLETIYNYHGSPEQRDANYNKFMAIVMEFEKANGDDLRLFLKTLQNNIFFNEHGENEAFFKSDNLESIEICTIHSTKGLAYPMVILANSQKGLYTQIQSDSIKNNNFELSNGTTKQIAGFKVNGYEPLAFRLLKKIDKLKHLAEKKRLLYVALTRSEHDLVISGLLTKTKTGTITIREDSYLSMILNGLNTDATTMFECSDDRCLPQYQQIEIKKDKVKLSNNQRKLIELHFTNKKLLSATQRDGDETVLLDDTKAKLGTITHKVFELYWNRLGEIDSDQLFAKFDIYDEKEKEQILESISKFKDSDVYSRLKNGAKHCFELEFNHNGKTGFIDLVYYSEEENGWVIIDFKTGKMTPQKEAKYQEQLDFYREVLNNNKMNIVDARLLWV